MTAQTNSARVFIRSTVGNDTPDPAASLLQLLPLRAAATTTIWAGIIKQRASVAKDPGPAPSEGREFVSVAIRRDRNIVQRLIWSGKTQCCQAEPPPGHSISTRPGAANPDSRWRSIRLWIMARVTCNSGQQIRHSVDHPCIVARPGMAACVGTDELCPCNPAGGIFIAGIGAIAVITHADDQGWRT